jgi:hypothetical protein
MWIGLNWIRKLAREMVNKPPRSIMSWVAMETSSPSFEHQLG